MSSIRISKGNEDGSERKRIDTSGMNAKTMRVKLSTFNDFAEQKTLLQELIQHRGHLCYYIPKFHCELNPIERCWCHAKKLTRAQANGSIIRLRKIVKEGLESVTVGLIQKYFRTVRAYEACYLQGYVVHVMWTKQLKLTNHIDVYIVLISSVHVLYICTCVY